MPEVRTEQVVPERIPAICGFVEKGTRSIAPLSLHRLESSLVYPCCRGWLQSFPNQRPDRLQRRIERCATVKTARPLTSGFDPSTRGKHLEMSADRRLRALQDVAKLGYGQFPTFEQTQQSTAQIIRKSGDLLEYSENRL